MTATKVLIVLVALAVLAGGAPVRAEQTATATDTGEALPAACEGRSRPPHLEADEQLVERTFYFTGPSRIGNIDGLTDPTSLRMVEERPSDETSKVYRNAPLSPVFVPINVTPNDPRDPSHAHFERDVAEPVRIVCFAADFWGVSTREDRFGLALWLDSLTDHWLAIYFSADPHPTEQRRWTARIPSLNRIVDSDILVRFASPAYHIPGTPTGLTPGAAFLYDSTTQPSSATFVFVEKA